MESGSGPTQEAGRRLGHYRLLERIGGGGMGEVWRARDERLERDVALKVLLPGTIVDEAARKRFRHEALALSRLNHPCVATIHDFDNDSGTDFLVMELVSGKSLQAHRADGAVAEPEVIRLGLQLAEGLAAAHAEGIVHRDLKPANVRLTVDGRLKILDFGLAYLTRAAGGELGSMAPTRSVSVTEPGAMLGTLGYMSPEQVRGERADARADLWAAGLILYELATGRRAFEDTGTAPLLHAILNEPVSSPRKVNPRVSTALEAIILKCVQKEPASRYASANELAADLTRLQQGVSVEAERTQVRARRLRGMAVAVPVVIVLALASLIALDVGGLRTRFFAPPAIRSIAVLPLANLSGDPTQEYFADGITETLINVLGRVGALRVISRTSVMRYKGTNRSLRQIAKELSVDAVVEGSITRAGDRVRISAQLIDVKADRQLWAQSFDRQLRDVLAMQSDVALAITQQIQAKLTPSERAWLSQARPVDPVAHDAYLRGLYAMNEFSDASVRAALEWFRKAVALDSTYAPPHAAMTNVYDFLADVSMPTREAVALARAEALKAIQLDSTLSDSHVALAQMKIYWEWDWAGARRELTRAIELNPNDARAHTLYAVLLRATGEYRGDLEEARLAAKLAPLNRYEAAQIGWAHFFGRHYGEAIQEFRACVVADPKLVQAQFGLGLTLEQVGDRPGAIGCMRAAQAIVQNDDFDTAIIHILGGGGRRREARAMLDSLLVRHGAVPLGAYSAAIALAGLGEREHALDALVRIADEPSGQSTFFNVDPRLDSLRADVRYVALAQRLGVPPHASNPGEGGR